MSIYLVAMHPSQLLVRDYTATLTYYVKYPDYYFFVRYHINNISIETKHMAKAEKSVTVKIFIGAAVICCDALSGTLLFLFKCWQQSNDLSTKDCKTKRL